MKYSVGIAVVLILLACIQIQGVPLSPSSLLKRWRNWGKSSEGNADPSQDTGDDSDEMDDYDHLPYELKMVTCPSRPEEELQDYWRCLWLSSLTAKGIEQERMDMIQGYYEAASHIPLPDYLIKKRKAELMKEEKEMQVKVVQPVGIKQREVKEAVEEDDGELDIVTLHEDEGNEEEVATTGPGSPPHRDGQKTAALRRVKRQTPSQIVDKMVEANLFKLARAFTNSKDVRASLADSTVVEECQRKHIKPGRSLILFISCLTEASSLKLVASHPELGDPPYPEVDINYDPRDFPLVSMNLNEDNPSTESKYTLQFSYDRIKNDDDVATSFSGADPYLLEQLGDFRHRYDLSDKTQETPAWSYVGKNGAHSWHKQELRKLFLPLRPETDLKRTAFFADFAQTYPGIGELASELEELDTPMDYKWQKDKGYQAHNRYLLPLLVEGDLTYYKYKKVIDESVTVRPDAEIIGDIIQALKSFQNQTRKEIVKGTPQKIADIPFVKTYNEFLIHYYKVDVGQLIEETKKFHEKYKPGDTVDEFVDTQLRDHYEGTRKLAREYVDSVLDQQECLKEMLDKYDYRREREDVTELLDKAKDCPVKSADGSDAGKANLLRELYQEYFVRKEARRAYSLPVYPETFPMCRHSEPSPIDILTKKGRESSLRDYEFGQAGYRLNRFFMMVPNDGTPLLCLGILHGERLDDSSVRLSGGAVKGQNLTFQYMFFRFGKNWDERGSEHSIDGKAAPFEVQMVFTLAGSADMVKYWHVLARVQNQLFQFRGKLVIILSVLVDVLETDDQVIKRIRDEKTKQDPYLFEPLAQAAYHFRKEWESHPAEDVPRGYVSKEPTFRLVDFIPKVKTKFYTYRGSLTWPPCFGYVVWSVYDHRLYMSKRQFDQFAKIPAFGLSDNTLLADNYRAEKDIFVEDEHNQDLDYSEVQALKNKRTVDRFVLAGEHLAVLHSSEEEDIQGIVDEQGYYDTADSKVGSSKVPATGGFLITTTLLLFGLA